MGFLTLQKILLWVVLLNALVFAHSTVMVEVGFSAVFDETGFSGVRNHWVYDEESSREILYKAFGVDSLPNDTLASQIVFDNIFEKASEKNYYCYVLNGAEFVPATGVSSFKVTYKAKKIVLDFIVNFSIPARDEYTMIVAVVSDQTNAIMMDLITDKVGASFPKSLDVEYFYDFVHGMTMMKAFRSEVEGLFLRFRTRAK